MVLCIMHKNKNLPFARSFQVKFVQKGENKFRHNAQTRKSAGRLRVRAHVAARISFQKPIRKFWRESSHGQLAQSHPEIFVQFDS